jgi:hypothetical protein
MDFQSKRGTEMKFRGNQEILNEMEKVWNTVARIEKSSEEMLDEGNPILESLGFAWVHMMNACQEIEDSLNQGTGNKLVPKTLVQIIDVLTKIKWTGTKYRNGLIDAYQTAVQNVGKFHGIDRNTIADACTRRLQLDRDGFLDLVERWFAGDSGELERTLKLHCSFTEHGLIHDFFQKKGGFRENY